MGSDGSFVVTWEGYDGTSDSIYVQKFDATGAKVSGLGATGVGAEAGVLYLVSDTVTVSGLSSVASAADALWNQVSTMANASSPLDATGLLDGSYHLYLADLAGNLSAMDAAALTVTAGVIHA